MCTFFILEIGLVFGWLMEYNRGVMDDAGRNPGKNNH